MNMSNCSSCGSEIPDGQGSSCSMCYGDIGYGRDGYYEAWARECENIDREYDEWYREEIEKEQQRERKLIEDGIIPSSFGR